MRFAGSFVKEQGIRYPDRMDGKRMELTPKELERLLS
jgi:hypothetical protein